PVEVGARLEDEHVEPRLGQDRRRDGAARSRAGDRDVALGAVAARAQVAERPLGRRGWRVAGDLAAQRVAEAPLDGGVAAVAEAAEHLEQQQKVLLPGAPRALEAGQELLPRLKAGAAEAPGERKPVESAQAEPDEAERALREARHVAGQ